MKNHLKPLRVALLACAFAGIMVQACGAQNGAGPGRWVIPPPADGVYTGVYGGERSNEGSCDGASRSAGKPMQFCLVFASIRTLPRILANPETTAIGSSGTIPFASLACRGSGTYGQIAGGADDAFLQRDAEALRSYASRFPKNPLVMMRPFHEFNVNIGDPRGNPNGNNCFSAPESLSQAQSEFISAYRHVVTFFASHGVTNVTWAWCPAVGPEAWARHGGQELLSGFYPGDQYVDWTCADGYDKSASGGGIRNALGNLGFFTQFHKPLIIGETGECNSEQRSPKCGGYSQTQDQYFRDLASALQPGGWLAGDGVKAVIYFDQSVERSGYNWSFDSGGLRAFHDLVGSSYFYPSMPQPRWESSPG